MVESHVPSEEEKAAVLQAQCQAREEAMVSHNYMFLLKMNAWYFLGYYITCTLVFFTLISHNIKTGKVHNIDYIILLQWYLSRGEIY